MRLRAISIHSSNCARPFVHRLRWPCEEIESATNLEASKRIDRARSRSAMACVWQRDDEWGASDARSTSVMDAWRLPSSSFPQVDRSIARCGCAFRQLCMQRPSHKPKKIVRRHKWRALTRAGVVCVRGRDRMVWARREW